MENNIEIFKNSEFGEVRTMLIDGEPWFVGKDVAEALGYKDTDAAIRMHVDDEDKLTRQFIGSGQARAMTIINEPGLYSLVLSSKLPSAKQFKHWVTSEVLPSIRKTGSYSLKDNVSVPSYQIEDPIKRAEAWIEEQKKALALKADNEKKQKLIEEQKPKADYFDNLVDRNLLTNFRDTAKQLGIGQKTFINFLLEREYVYRDKAGKIKPYITFNHSLFEVKDYENDGHVGHQTLITPKGKETFKLLIWNYYNKQFS